MTSYKINMTELDIILKHHYCLPQRCYLNKKCDRITKENDFTVYSSNNSELTVILNGDILIDVDMEERIIFFPHLFSSQFGTAISLVQKYLI